MPDFAFRDEKARKHYLFILMMNKALRSSQVKAIGCGHIYICMFIYRRRGKQLEGRIHEVLPTAGAGGGEVQVRGDKEDCTERTAEGRAEGRTDARDDTYCSDPSRLVRSYGTRSLRLPNPATTPTHIGIFP